MDAPKPLSPSNQFRLPPSVPLTWETILWFILIGIAFLTRFYDLGSRVLSHDEVVHAMTAWRLFQGEGYIYLPYEHGPLQFQLIAFVFALFGGNDATIRIPAALFGVVSVVLMYAFRKDMGKTGALIAAVGLTFSPYLMYYDRYARNESFIVVWWLITLFALLRYCETRSNGWLYLFTAAIAFHFVTKETAYIYAAVLLIFLSLRLGFLFLAERPKGIRAWLRMQPTFDLWIVLVVVTLPLLVGIPMIFFNLTMWAGVGPSNNINDVWFWLGVMACAIPLIGIAGVIGWLWDRRRIVRVAFIFGAIYLTLYSCFFSSPGSWATGNFGGLNYWLIQHSVQRGNQPWYYYLFLQIPLYEFLPAILASLAPIVFLRAWFVKRKSPAVILPAGSDQAAAAKPINGLLVSFLSFWAMGALFAFSAAGEKMPWLTVHITLPCILLGGYLVGYWISQTDWTSFTSRNRWAGLVLLPILLLTSLWSIGKWLGAHPPFTSNDLIGLQSTSEWISTSIVSILGWGILIRIWRTYSWTAWLRMIALAGTGWLFLITVHTAIQASFTNSNSPNEFIYYAHFGPGVRTVNRLISGMAETKAVGSSLNIDYDTNAGWTYAWYLRNYPQAVNIGDTVPADAAQKDAVLLSSARWQDANVPPRPAFQLWEGIRIWWPLMDYMNLNEERIWYAAGDGAYRQALWDIWYYRDFTLYGKLTNQDLTLERWPVSERMRLYYRP